MHKQITKDWSSDNIRAVQLPLEAESICFHVPSCQMIHFFPGKSYSYGESEKEKFFKDTLHYSKSYSQLRVFPVYYGVKFTLSWFNDEWFLGGRSMMKCNESNFGGSRQLITVFKETLGLYDLKIDDFDKRYIYAFNVCSNDYSPIEIEASLDLLGVYDYYTLEFLDHEF